jgi:hypothetical protein
MPQTNHDAQYSGHMCPLVTRIKDQKVMLEGFYESYEY